MASECFRCATPRPLPPKAAILITAFFLSFCKHKTGKGVSEHMVQSLNEQIDCSMTSSNELAEMFFDDYNNLDCYLEKN